MAVLHWREPDQVGMPLSHHVAERLREAILDGDLRPGDRLVEARIAAQLNLSRDPVRHALKQLEMEGLVTISPRRCTFVSRLDTSDVGEIASLRGVLEGLAARLVAEGNGREEMDRLEALLAEMAAAGDEHPVRFATLDLAFHEALCRASGHKRLLQFWCTLRTRIWMFIRETRLGGLLPAEPGVELHRAILDAIRRGDGEEAERLARRHSKLPGQQLEVLLADETSATDRYAIPRDESRGMGPAPEMPRDSSRGAEISKRKEGQN